MPVRARLIADMSMSLDGRIATPDDDISRLIRWFFDGDTEVAPGAPFRTSQASAELLREALETVGAIVGGRRYFDLAQGWGGRHPMGVPVFILTHEPPADWPNDSSIHFVTDGLHSAVAQARSAAGDKHVAIATPGTVRQCLDAGILDELQVNVVPVVLGEACPSSTASTGPSSSRAPRSSRGQASLTCATEPSGTRTARQRPGTATPRPSATRTPRPSTSRTADGASLDLNHAGPTVGGCTPAEARGIVKRCRRSSS